MVHVYNVIILCVKTFILPRSKWISCMVDGKTPERAWNSKINFVLSPIWWKWTYILLLLWSRFIRVRAKLCRGSGSVAPLVRNLGTSWRWVISFTLQPLYFQAKHPPFSLNRRIAGPQGQPGRCGEEKNLGAFENRSRNCYVTGKFRLCTSQLTWLNVISRGLQLGWNYNWHGRGRKCMQFFRRYLLVDNLSWEDRIQSDRRETEM